MMKCTNFGVAALVWLSLGTIAACSGDYTELAPELGASPSGSMGELPSDERMEPSELTDPGQAAELGAVDPALDLAAEPLASGEEAQLGQVQQALGLGCFQLLPGNLFTCPAGFTATLSNDVFRCAKTNVQNTSCPFGFEPRPTQTGVDRCRVVACLPLTDCSDRNVQCPAGTSRVTDRSGTRDACVSTSFQYPSDCLGFTPDLGITCPPETEGSEVVENSFRCLDHAVPTCPIGSRRVTRPGADQCRSLLGDIVVAEPQCEINPDTALLFDYERDVVGNGDRCVAHGLQAPQML